MLRRLVDKLWLGGRWDNKNWLVSHTLYSTLEVRRKKGKETIKGEVYQCDCYINEIGISNINVEYSSIETIIPTTSTHLVRRHVERWNVCSRLTPENSKNLFVKRIIPLC